MNFLELIAETKQKEVKIRKSQCPASALEKSSFFLRDTLSLKSELCRAGSSGIIAEFKRRSPSHGIINLDTLPEEVCLDYVKAGSSAVSVLTDNEYFGGTSDDLVSVRKNVDCPVLRKDFIIDEYQILEARSIGSDAILLITELLPAGKLEKLFRFARSLGLEVLVELHDRKSMAKIPYDAEIIGINNRDLSTFDVKTLKSAELICSLPQNIVKVAESGIRSAEDCLNLKKSGFNAFLIGGYFMESSEPGQRCEKFISELNYLGS